MAVERRRAALTDAGGGGRRFFLFLLVLFAIFPVDGGVALFSGALTFGCAAARCRRAAGLSLDAEVKVVAVQRRRRLQQVRTQFVARPEFLSIRAKQTTQLVRKAVEISLRYENTYPDRELELALVPPGKLVRITFPFPMTLFVFFLFNYVNLHSYNSTVF